MPGLVTEADTIEALDAKLQTMVPELLEANGCLPSGESQQEIMALLKLLSLGKKELLEGKFQLAGDFFAEMDAEE